MPAGGSADPRPALELPPSAAAAAVTAPAEPDGEENGGGIEPLLALDAILL
jgi:hypothetical protein